MHSLPLSYCTEWWQAIHSPCLTVQSGGRPFTPLVLLYRVVAGRGSGQTGRGDNSGYTRGSTWPSYCSVCYRRSPWLRWLPGSVSLKVNSSHCSSRLPLMLGWSLSCLVSIVSHSYLALHVQVHVKLLKTNSTYLSDVLDVLMREITWHLCFVYLYLMFYIFFIFEVFGESLWIN